MAARTRPGSRRRSTRSARRCVDESLRAESLRAESLRAEPLRVDEPARLRTVRGRRLGVDVGSVRVGVALSDPDGVLATPLVTVPRDVEHGTDLRTLAALVEEHLVVEVIVGLPRTLAGREGPAAELARAFAEALAGVVTVPVVLSDERLTTVVATQQLRERGVRGRKQRAVIDQAAAVAILQGWLDSRR